MTLQRITIQNYQSLGKLRLDLGKFTVIVGQSDVGKSAIVRAIRAAISNQVGTSFVKTGQKSTGVGLIFDDVKIAWKKTSGAAAATAEYILDIPGKDVAHFSKMGRDVPAAVVKALRMGELSIAGEKIWPTIHAQFNLPFLMGATALERARLIGEITGINLIHSATREVQARDRKAKAELAVYTSQLKDAETRIFELGDLDSLKQKLDAVNEAYLSASDVEAKLISIFELASAIEEAIEMLRESSTEHESLRKAVEDIHIEKGASLALDISTLRNCIESIEYLRNAISEYATEIEKRAVEIKEAREQLAGINVCPLCERPMGEQHG